MLFSVLLIVLCVGLVVASVGLIGFIRDGRRLNAFIYTVVGGSAALLAGGLLLYQQGAPSMLFVTGALVVVIVLVGNLIAYPVLTVFLLWSGVTVMRRESRSLGNALALVAGIGMVLLPATLQLLAPPDTPQDDVGYIIRYAAHFALVLLVGYVAFCFAAFLLTSWLYRWRRIRTSPVAIIILGSGLINGKVPPLLAGRLRRGLDVQRTFDTPPLIITSGGQGPDEPLPEGTAMREFLIDQGADPRLVVAETESRNTAQNLKLSRALLPDPHAPVLVVTSSYHVFRAALLTRGLGMNAHVIGARTVWYFLPSAVLREFVGVMRDYLRIHVVAVALIIVFAAVSSFVLVPAMIPPVAH